MLVSASRRTDIPACYPRWLLNRMREGFVLVPNPRNPRQLSKVSLLKEEVEGIVFWTKNPLPLLPYLDELEGFEIPYGFQFTITPYGKDIEPNLPEKDALIEAFGELSRRLGPGKLDWRYDPVILSGEWTVKRHLAAFDAMAHRLSGSTGRCVFSFADWYRKLPIQGKALVSQGWDPGEMQAVAEGFLKTARNCGMVLTACCEEADLGRWGVEKEACISKRFSEAIIGCPVEGKKDPRQRAGCDCIQSADIGMYDTCINGCLYCYANAEAGRIRKNAESHHPESPVLVGWPLPDAAIAERRLPSIGAAQLTLPFENKNPTR